MSDTATAPNTTLPGLAEALGGTPETPSRPGDQPYTSAGSGKVVDEEGPPPAGSPATAAAEQGSKQDEAPSAPGEFADANLKVPEGIQFEGDSRKEFAEIAKGLPQETAQRLVDYGSKLLKAAAEESSTLWTKTNESWVTETKADKEIGGERLDREVLPAIGRLFDEYAGDRQKLVQALDMTGAGNHPAVVRLLWNLSKALNEGRPVATSPASKAPRPDAAHAIYPNLP